MPLVTAPGAPDAASYVSQAEADAYFLARLNAAWAAALPDAKDGALVTATAYADAEYEFKGTKASAEQSLKWPRYDVVVDGYPVLSTAIPAALKNGVCELALRALAGPLLKDIAPEVVTEKTVDVITTKFAPARANGGKVRYPYVDTLLRGLVAAGGLGTSKMVRG